MKNKLVALFVVVGVVVLLVGCGREEEPDPQPATELLIGNWVLTSLFK